MGEFTAVLIALIALCLLVSLIYARKTSSSVELFDPRPADYAFTIWAEQSAGFDPAGSADATRPQRITAEYLVRLQADSAEELEEAQVEFIRRINADFHRHFPPLLGKCDIGAVLCQPAEERE